MKSKKDGKPKSFDLNIFFAIAARSGNQEKCKQKEVGTLAYARVVVKDGKVVIGKPKTAGTYFVGGHAARRIEGVTFPEPPKLKNTDYVTVR